MPRTVDHSPHQLGLCMPAEWAPHAATWMSWPFDEEMWWGQLAEVRREYAALVRTIAQFEPVHLLLRDDEAAFTAKAALAGVGNILLHRVPLNDVWLRDNGAIFVLPRPDFKGQGDEPGTAMVNWGFNAWGGKYDWELDNQVPFAMAALLGQPRFDVDIIMEGGSLDVNGAGLCLTTEQCLLTPTRNPKLGKEQIAAYLRDYLGITQLIWLRQGLEGDHTDGHVDTITRFTGPTTVVSSVPPVGTAASDPNVATMQENLEILRQVRLPSGAALTVLELPLPAKSMSLADGQRLPATYANFYVLNAAVVVPQYGDPQVEKALDVLRQAFPGRQVIGLSSRYLITGGGSFHCLTQQQPRAFL